jgi:hypothetical protein
MGVELIRLPRSDRSGRLWRDRPRAACSEEDRHGQCKRDADLHIRRHYATRVSAITTRGRSGGFSSGTAGCPAAKDERTTTHAAVRRAPTADRSACRAHPIAMTVPGFVRTADPSPLVGRPPRAARADAGRRPRPPRQSAQALAARHTGRRPPWTRSQNPTGPGSRRSTPIRRSGAPKHPNLVQLLRPRVKRYGIEVAEGEGRRPSSQNPRLTEQMTDLFPDLFLRMLVLTNRHGVGGDLVDGERHALRMEEAPLPARQAPLRSSCRLARGTAPSKYAAVREETACRTARGVRGPADHSLSNPQPISTSPGSGHRRLSHECQSDAARPASEGTRRALSLSESGRGTNAEIVESVPKRQPRSARCGRTAAGSAWDRK